MTERRLRRRRTEGKGIPVRRVRQTLAAAVLLMVAAASTVHAADVGDGDGISPDELISGTGVENEGDTALPPAGVLDHIDMGRMGSVTLHLTDGKPGTEKGGVEFHIERVADIKDGKYVLVPECAGLGVDLNDMENSEDMLDAAERLDGHGTDGTSGETDSDGALTFEDLEVGVYLVSAEDSKTYDEVSPSLIAVPTWDDTEGDMQYDVTLEPKHTPRVDVDVERNEAPQTGLRDATMRYVAVGSVCLLGAAVVGIILLAVSRRGKRRHGE